MATDFALAAGDVYPTISVSESKQKFRRVKAATRALQHRNYRIYFFAMLLSFVGTWMQNVAQSWLVYRLTGSEWLLGLVGFAGQIPVFLLTPLGGVMADRYHRRRIILITQILAMLQAGALAYLTLSGAVTVNVVIGLALLLGTVNALDLPTRQSFLADLVAREDLMNAIALNSSMVNLSRIVGPAVAGVLVAWVGEGFCFLINAVSYLFVIGGLLLLRVEKKETKEKKPPVLYALKEGFDYVRRTTPIRALLLLVSLVSVSGLSFTVLMPVIADKVLHGGSGALGLMLGASGIGSLAGALTLASRGKVQGLGRIVAASVGAFGLLLIAFSYSRSLALSTALLAPMGFTVMLQMSGSNTLLQTMVEDRLRGRMMSFFSMSFMGMAPFGSLLAGAIADRIGAPRTLTIGGAVCVLGAMIFYWQIPRLRREAAPLLASHEINSGLWAPRDKSSG